MIIISAKHHFCAEIVNVRTGETTTTICVPMLKHPEAAQPRGGAKAA